MLEEEAGYFNLSRTLSWKKEPEQRSVASPAEPALLTIEEGGKEGREGREGSEGREGREGSTGPGEDAELENLASDDLEREDDTCTPPENI